MSEQYQDILKNKAIEFAVEASTFQVNTEGAINAFQQENNEDKQIEWTNILMRNLEDLQNRLTYLNLVFHHLANPLNEPDEEQEGGGE